MSPPIISSIVRDIDGKLTITGTNFNGLINVKIGGVVVDVEQTSSTQITTVPTIQIEPNTSESIDGGFTGKYLVVKVGGINYKLSLLAESP
jgi:hypothetical protein